MCIRDRAEIVVLAVKPQTLQGVARQLAPEIQTRQPLVISVAAGVREPDLRRWLGGGSLALVRTMPNTPALVGSAASAPVSYTHLDVYKRQIWC